MLMVVYEASHTLGNGAGVSVLNTHAFPYPFVQCLANSKGFKSGAFITVFIIIILGSHLYGVYHPCLCSKPLSFTELMKGTILQKTL